MRTSIPDDDIIAQTAAGDRRSFALLVKRHAPAVLRLARAIATDDASAADVVQETFLAAFRGASTYRPGVSTVRTWLFAIARNTARRALRRGVEEPLSDPEASLERLGMDAGWGAEAPVMRFEVLDLLSRAIASLPPADREVIVLCDVEALPRATAAEVLGITMPALKSRLHRARMRLVAAVRVSEGGVAGQNRKVGALTCTDVLQHLGDYVDGELPASARSEVDVHLRECTVCERFGGRYAGVVHAVRARLGAAPGVDEAQLERIHEALRRG